MYRSWGGLIGVQHKKCQQSLIGWRSAVVHPLPSYYSQSFYIAFHSISAFIFILYFSPTRAVSISVFSFFPPFFHSFEIAGSCLGSICKLLRPAFVFSTFATESYNCRRFPRHANLPYVYVHHRREKEAGNTARSVINVWVCLHAQTSGFFFRWGSSLSKKKKRKRNGGRLWGGWWLIEHSSEGLVDRANSKSIDILLDPFRRTVAS